MASLELSRRRAWSEALSATRTPWVACGFSVEQLPTAATLEGMLGLVDWLVHGQVSRMVKSGQLAASTSCVIPGDPERGRPSFLLFPVGRGASAGELAEKARALGIGEVALAETTFPEDFLAKLKQTLKKDGVRFTALEPET